MVRDYRVKEVILQGLTTTSGTIGSNFGYYSEDINGEILKISYLNNVTAGSLSLYVSGTNELLWQRANISGVGWQVAYPFVYRVDSSNTTGSPHSVDCRIVNGLPLYYCGSGFGGGSIVNIIVHYR
jgi:hypothetical protein